jgi:hypothetical protein
VSHEVSWGDHLSFAVAATAPDTLLVRSRRLSALIHDGTGAIDRHGAPSVTLFAVNTSRLYQTSAVPPGARVSAALIDEQASLPLEIKNPGRTVENRFEYNAHMYPIRGRPDSGRAMRASLDGRLGVLTTVGQPPRGGSGYYYIDVFDLRSGKRLAGLDLETKAADPVGMLYNQIHFLNGRWLAVTLDNNLQTLLLFDFQPALL